MGNRFVGETKSRSSRNGHLWLKTIVMRQMQERNEWNFESEGTLREEERQSAQAKQLEEDPEGSRRRNLMHDSGKSHRSNKS